MRFIDGHLVLRREEPRARESREPAANHRDLHWWAEFGWLVRHQDPSPKDGCTEQHTVAGVSRGTMGTPDLDRARAPRCRGVIVVEIKYEIRERREAVFFNTHPHPFMGSYPIFFLAPPHTHQLHGMWWAPTPHISSTKWSECGGGRFFMTVR